MKFCSHFRYVACLVFPFFLTACAQGHGDAMNGFTCNTLAPHVFSEEVARIENQVLYKPASENKKFEAKFRFSLPASGNQSVLSIESARLNEQLVYRGPVTQEFSLDASMDLLEEGGIDNFSFTIYDPDDASFCTQTQDAAQAYWTDRGIVRIEFLDAPELDPETQRPVRHRTRIE